MNKNNDMFTLTDSKCLKQVSRSSSRYGIQLKIENYLYSVFGAHNSNN